MAFPDSVLPIKNEFLIGGSWTDVTSYTRGPDQAGMTITRGFSGEQSALSAGTAQFTLNNRDGRFSNRNPMSPYYGLLGFNVQHRASTLHTSKYLRMTDSSVPGTSGYDGARAETLDKAVLDITGDIDIRADVEPDHWLGRPGQLLVTKYAPSGNNRSFAFYSDEKGFLRFTWTTDGTGSAIRSVPSTVPVPSFSGRLAVRVTFDVDNGSGNHTATFYTSTSISGTWVQLGLPTSTGGGVTSIYNGSANLEVGTIAGGAGRISVFGGGGLGAADPFCGKIYAAEVRNGIGGTLVAKMDATAQTVGATSWSDGLGTPNTWTLYASAEISQADYRFWGEMPKISLRADPTNTDVIAPVQSTDLVARLTGRSKPLRSAIYRNLHQYVLNGTFKAYWPMDNQATGASGSVIGADKGKQGYVGDGDFGQTTGLPGTGGSLIFSSDSGYASGALLVDPADPFSSTGITCNLWYWKLDKVPASATYVEVIAFYHTFSNIDSIRLYCNNVGMKLDVIDTVGTVILSTTSTYAAGGGAPTSWRAMKIELTQNGTGADWAWGWYVPLGATLFGLSGTIASTKVGDAVSWISWPFTDKFGMQLAHVAFGRSIIDFAGYGFIASTNGYAGEAAASRWMRLLAEERVPGWLVGVRLLSGTAMTLPMGAQRPLPFMDLLQEIADVDGGLIYAPRDKFGLTLRLASSLQNQPPVSINYSQDYFSGELLPDEPNNVRNDITITGLTGATARAVKDSGALNVNEPSDDPNGAGRIAVELPRNGADITLTDLATRERMFGTWPDLRFTKAQFFLQRRQFTGNPTLLAGMRALDIGDPIEITNLPTWISYESLSVMIRGYSELLENQRQEFSHNLVPYGPYITGKWGPYAGPLPQVKWQASNITLKAAVAAGVTTIVVRGLNYNDVTFSNTSNYDLVIDGERVGVLSGNVGGRTSSGGYWEQTITNVVRAKNGVAKTMKAASPVRVWLGGRWG